MFEVSLQFRRQRVVGIQRRSGRLLHVLLFGLVILSIAEAPVSAQKMKPVAISTRWAKDVDPANPLPEYPRPQMVRSQWLNLNGIWQVKSAFPSDPVPVGKELSGKIVVPFPVESALSGVKLHFDRLWYRRTFSIPPAWGGKRVILHFGAVDYESEVYINGKSVGLHRGGYDPFSFDITGFLSGTGPQEIIVRVYDPTEFGGQPRGKQTTNPEYIMYTPTTGIWQTTWLEPVEAASIDNLKIVPDADRGQLHLLVNSTKPAIGSPVNVVVKDGDKVVATLEGRSNTELVIPIASPKLWTPEHPFLYDLEVTLNGKLPSADKVISYFGMRTIEIGKVDGFNRILLNHKPVFEIGPLDQGFWPDGLYTAPTDAALKSDIEAMKNLGFNMVRKHVKVEPARWYYWADKLGILVWQDMPSADSYLFLQPINATPPVDKEEYESELRRMIETHWNSPAIVTWTIFNEGQGQFDTPRLVEVVKKLDPNRLVNEASGNTITGAGDLDDVHSYPAPNIRPPTPNQALVDGEFGGIGELVPGHAWQERGGGYTNVSTPDDLLYLYAEYLNMVKDYRDHNGLAAVVYTQLTDVETELNGLLTYDRLPKVDMAKIALANRFELPAPSYKVVVPSSESTRQLWKYTVDAPAKEWNQNAFNDAQWSEGRGGFGNVKDRPGTAWNSGGIWMRRHFNPGNLTPDQLMNLVSNDLHVGDIEIFINGVLAYSQGKSSANYERRSLTRDARAAVKVNVDNILAVHCGRRGDTQWVDAGLDLRVPKSN